MILKKGSVLNSGNIFSILLVLFFGILAAFIEYSDRLEKDIQNRPESDYETIFARIKDIHSVYKRSRKNYTVTYVFSDRTGMLHERTEETDNALVSRLRVGDIAECRKLETEKQGILYSRLKGNTVSVRRLEFIKTFSLYCLYFSILLFAVSFLI